MYFSFLILFFFPIDKRLDVFHQKSKVPGKISNITKEVWFPHGLTDWLIHLFIGSSIYWLIFIFFLHVRNIFWYQAHNKLYSSKQKIDVLKKLWVHSFIRHEKKMRRKLQWCSELRTLVHTDQKLWRTCVNYSTFCGP